MKKKIPDWLNVFLCVVFGLTITLAFNSLNLAATSIPHTTGQAATSVDQLKAAYGHLPLSFEVNQGQTDTQVKFLSRGSGYSLFLTPTEAVLALSTPQGKSKAISHGHAVKSQPTANTSTSVVRMQLVESNQQPKVAGLEQLPGIVNYFLGNDPKQWHRNIPTYAKVQYQQVYPGVDMVYYGNQQQLEYDFVLAPGADPNTIKLAFQGADKLELDTVNDLVLHTAGGQIKLHKPLVYQEVNGVRQAVVGGYQLKDKQLLSFQVGGYDATKPLIIDPVLSYSTYLGGSGNENRGNGIAVDRLGNAYVTGETLSSDFPTKNPFQATSAGVFVTKLNPTGTALVYSTYLGGSFGDVGIGIAVDKSGNAYVTGETESSNFPTKNPFQAALSGSSDAFVTKLNPTGSALVYSTYLGGSSGDTYREQEQGSAIAVDESGNAYVTGVTYSRDFPIKNPFQAALGGFSNAFVTKLNPTGSALVYSTYLGGNTSNIESRDGGSGIAVDKAGNAYVTGTTNSTNFPTKNPFQATYGDSGDAFVTKLEPTGSALVYSTYLGGSNSDYSSGIAVDKAGNAYVTGTTYSRDFPIKNPFQAALGGSIDAFVTKLNPTGNALVYSTYLGGSNDDFGNGIAVDRSGKASVTGYTGSTNFPTQNPFQALPGGGLDVFVTKLEPTGSALVYSTYLGGSDFDLGSGITIDRLGDAYVTGTTYSRNFPTQNPFQAALAGGSNTHSNVFITKLTH